MSLYPEYMTLSGSYVMLESVMGIIGEERGECVAVLLMLFCTLVLMLLALVLMLVLMLIGTCFNAYWHLF